MLLRFLLLFLAPSLACATVYTIGANHPDPELEKDLSNLKGTLQLGDEVIIANGTYSDQALKFIGIGTDMDPITLRAETPGGVILNGTSYVQFDGDYLIVEGILWYNGDDHLRKTNSRAVEFRGSVNRHANHCRLTNCAIIDYNYLRIDDGDDDNDGDFEDYVWEHSKKWIEIFGTNNRVDHCYFYTKRTEASLIVVELRPDSEWVDEDPARTDETPQYVRVGHRIDHNFFGDIEWTRDDRTENNEAIRIGTSSYSSFNAEVMVENNYFYACNGDAETISNKSQNNIIRNNVLYRCLGGIVMRHGDGALVANNIILGDGQSRSPGIRINGQDHVVVGNYISGVMGTGMRAAITMRNAGSVTGDDLGGGYEQARFNTIAYNTVVESTQPLYIGSSGSSDNDFKPVSNTIVNNLIYAPNASNAVISGLSSNEFDQAVTTWGGNIFYARALGMPEVTGVRFEDPLLELRPDGFYAPRNLSPAIGGAVSGFDSIGVDFDGEVFASSNGDVGADQISSLYAVLAQMDLGSVGPDWNEGLMPALASITPRSLGTVVLEVAADYPFLLSDYGVYQSADLSGAPWYPQLAEWQIDESGGFTAEVRIQNSAESIFLRFRD